MKKILLALFLTSFVFSGQAQLKKIINKQLTIGDTLNILLLGDTAQIKFRFFYDAAWADIENVGDKRFLFSYPSKNIPKEINRSSSLIVQASIICRWNNIWKPNTGTRKIGYSVKDNSKDSIYGYIEADFRGDGNCHDTIFLLNYVEYKIPKPVLSIYPNPYKIGQELSFNFPVSSYEIYDFTGKRHNINNLGKGVYFIIVYTENYKYYKSKLYVNE